MSNSRRYVVLFVVDAKLELSNLVHKFLVGKQVLRQIVVLISASPNTNSSVEIFRNAAGIFQSRIREFK